MAPAVYACETVPSTVTTEFSSCSHSNKRRALEPEGTYTRMIQEGLHTRSRLHHARRSDGSIGLSVLIAANEAPGARSEMIIELLGLIIKPFDHQTDS